MRRTAAVIALGLIAAGGLASDANASWHWKHHFRKANPPACATVWQNGGTLPANYLACTSPGGTTYVAPSVPCTTGRLYTYKPTNTDAYFAHTGGTIHYTVGVDPASTSEWTAEYAACTG